MKICALVDVMGTVDQSPEEEYKEILEELCLLLDLTPENVTFRTDVYPYALRNDAVDIYVIDFGGMLPGCEDSILSHFRELLTQIEDKPSTLFVLWSAFTQRWYETAIEAYHPGLSAPNVVIYSMDEGRDFAGISGWFGKEYYEGTVRVATCDEGGMG